MANPIRGLKNLQKRLKDLPEHIADQVDTYLDGKALDVHRDAVANVRANNSVDKGFLWNSIVPNIDQYLSKTISANASYSAYVEFGTGPNVRIPPGLEAFAAQFKGERPGNSKAQPFLFPAYFKNLRPRTVEKDLRKIIEKK